MPTIRIDEEVYSWLRSGAVPFDDTPNSVLRRLAKLDPPPAENDGSGTSEDRGNGASGEGTAPPLSGNILNRMWNVGVQHAVYHRDGTWFENLMSFPGALFDPNGYLVFETEDEYKSCPHLNIGRKLNVSAGIAAISGYKHMR